MKPSQTCKNTQGYRTRVSHKALLRTLHIGTAVPITFNSIVTHNGLPHVLHLSLPFHSSSSPATWKALNAMPTKVISFHFFFLLSRFCKIYCSCYEMKIACRVFISGWYSTINKWVTSCTPGSFFLSLNGWVARVTKISFVWTTPCLLFHYYKITYSLCPQGLPATEECAFIASSLDWLHLIPQLTTRSRQMQISYLPNYGILYLHVK